MSTKDVFDTTSNVLARATFREFSLTIRQVRSCLRPMDH